VPASLRVRGAEWGLSRAREARVSVFAPVCAELPAWRSAEPAQRFLQPAGRVALKGLASNGRHARRGLLGIGRHVTPLRPPETCSGEDGGLYAAELETLYLVSRINSSQYLVFSSSPARLGPGGVPPPPCDAELVARNKGSHAHGAALMTRGRTCRSRPGPNPFKHLINVG
jgi:hypothetical protein